MCFDVCDAISTVGFKVDSFFALFISFIAILLAITFFFVGGTTG